MPRKPRKPTLDSVAVRAAQLTSKDREELIHILIGLREENNRSLLNAQTQVDDKTRAQERNSLEEQLRDRYIELKYIPKPSGHKCGPYRYWRFYEDGKRRSVYLGKAEKPG